MHGDMRNNTGSVVRVVTCLTASPELTQRQQQEFSDRSNTATPSPERVYANLSKVINILSANDTNKYHLNDPRIVPIPYNKFEWKKYSLMNWGNNQVSDSIVIQGKDGAPDVVVVGKNDYAKYGIPRKDMTITYNNPRGRVYISGDMDFWNQVTQKSEANSGAKRDINYYIRLTFASELGIDTGR